MSAGFRTSSGNLITFEIEGVEEVQTQLDQLADDLKATAAFVMVSQVGDQVKAWMQDYVLAQGLYKTGALYNSIYSVAVLTDEGAYAEVGPDAANVKYALIQNYGGTIPRHWIAPVNAQALHWESGGKDYFSKGHYVGPSVIPARPYIEPAFEEHQDEILAIMMEVLENAIATELARAEW